MSLKRIELEQVGKRYRREWVLRNINLVFEPGNSYSLVGPNGSGKSTLLRILSGHLTPSRGNIRFFQEQNILEPHLVYQHLSYAAPYVDLIEELTLMEALSFHQQFKPFLHGLHPKDILELMDLQRAKDKFIRHFSSGMKQRLKLALALCSDTSLVLLDEPTTNLDKKGIAWYRQLIDRFCPNRLLIVASNVDIDIEFCKTQVNILDFK